MYGQLKEGLVGMRCREQVKFDSERRRSEKVAVWDM